MLKRYNLFILFIFCLSSCAQNKAIFYSKTEKIIPVINVPLSADILLSNAAEDFKTNFKIITGESLRIERSDGLNDNYNYIVLRINPTQKENFCIYRKEKNITIQGTSAQNLVFGINDFFKKYTSLSFTQKNKGVVNSKLDSIIDTPKKFSVCSTPSFEYREPYFSTNFNTNFSNWNKTNYLEKEWGIWGHNLPKILKEYDLPESVYAKNGSKRLKKQFCFTSDSLFKYVNKKVKLIYDSDHAFNKFMILPNDNNIVCTCSTCKAVGNTKNDAAPAVFTFLNKLAKIHTNKRFFTAAYITVKNVPRFKAEFNTGIFYSTINIQKGIPIEKSSYFKGFEKDIKKWRKYVNNVYIWDYSVNYDNYFDIYPSLSVTQQNLKLYKKLGVNGVFIHGSEYSYHTFQELKSTVFAKLLWNINLDINKEIAYYFNKRFSKKLAESLTNYYTFIDEAFAVNNKELGIYSGINKTTKKYLDPKVFFDFYEEFDLHTQANKYDKDYLKLATALTFLKLEIMRDYGYGKYGFASLNKDKEIIVKNDIGKLLDKLTVYSKSSNVKTYNEIKYKIEDYVDGWRKKIFNAHKRKHLFFKKPFEVLSKLDEGYQNTKILNDGAFGLRDYNTNWHIVSVDDLILKINKKDVDGAKKIALSFLQDQKHSIYYPNSVEILDTNNNLIRKIDIKSKNNKLEIKEVSIKIPNEFDSEQLPETFILHIKKNKINGKNLLACDEIIFY
ncbi:DUF4838 domain-containing protein [Polaribacter porphyrae]|uniref:DUF4838 domain-containing protein n=1 Tax=Polaribacter porphyrae TaxID=1137780 RepID=A0A2S7WMT1_9FLAO|nr:DUF4838 domain-containing protein [Polaribacter porphyrae]PQJ78893.1 hypothetical protein BTO18_06710 [Polaribacter porphyrae]